VRLAGKAAGVGLGEELLGPPPGWCPARRPRRWRVFQTSWVLLPARRPLSVAMQRR